MVLTDKETRLLALGYLSIDSTPKVNYATLAALTGMTKGSATTLFTTARKRATDLLAKGETAVEYHMIGGGSANAKKPKKDVDYKVNLNKNNTHNNNNTGGAANSITTAAPTKTTRKKSNAGTKEVADKRKPAASKAPNVTLEQVGSDTEAAIDADEEDNVASGAVTDATPQTPQQANLSGEVQTNDPYADMYGSGGEGSGPSTAGKNVPKAVERGKKRSRANTEKKGTAPALSGDSNSDSHEPVTPSKRLREMPKPRAKASTNTQIPTTPTARAFKRGSVNSPAPDGSKGSNEAAAQNITSPAASTDGANDAYDGDRNIVRHSIRNLKGPTKEANYFNDRDQETAARTAALAQERLKDMVDAMNALNPGESTAVPSSTPRHSSTSESPHLRTQLTTPARASNDPSTNRSTPTVTAQALRQPSSIACSKSPPTLDDRPRHSLSTSVASSPRTTSPLVKHNLEHKKKSFKLMPSRPIGQRAAASTLASEKEVTGKEAPRPRTPTPASKSKMTSRAATVGEDELMEIGDTIRVARV